MNELLHKRGFFSRYQEFLVFAGLWLWLGIIQVLETIPYSWGTYFRALLVFGIVQLPVLVFAWYKPHLKAVLTKRQYWTWWVLCFFVVVPVFTMGVVLWQPKGYSSFFIVSAAMSSVGLELLLIANRYYQKRVQHISWIKKIGLENAVLVSIVLFSLTVSAMAVSSMYNPVYDKGEQLLVGFEFSLPKIMANFGTFLGFSVQFLFMYLCGYLFFFINSRFLVSKVLKEKGLLMYLLSVLATTVFLYPVVAQLLILLPINRVFGRDIFSNNPFNIENAFAAIGIMLVSLPVVLALQWAKQNSRIVSLEKEKTQSELDLLKQQLNPHFFFNTLNNLYALSLQKSEKAPESILLLSELMRYVIYKGQEEKVTLAQELKYIQDYVQLQEMRLKYPLEFSFEQQIGNDGVGIAPLLLIVLVENAFKHGIEPAEDAAVLKLRIESSEERLYFSCENSFEPDDSAKVVGIGLSNLKRRLELLYPGRHSLTIEEKRPIFKVVLALNLL